LAAADLKAALTQIEPSLSRPSLSVIHPKPDLTRAIAFVAAGTGRAFATGKDFSDAAGQSRCALRASLSEV